jgi:prevent-host-death family protein
MEVDVHEAENLFDELLERAAAGEEIIITKDGRPAAKLVSIRPGEAAEQAAVVKR